MNKKLIIAVIALGSLGITSLYAATSAPTLKEKAIKKATQYVPANSKMLTAIEKGSYYEVKFYNKDTDEAYEVEVDHAAQAIEEFKSKKVNLRGSNTIKLDEEAAKKIVLNEYPNAEILSVTLDKDDWFQEYKIMIAHGNMRGEVEISPETGVILERDFERVSNIGAGNVGTGTIETSQSNTFMGIEKVKEITLKKIPGAAIIDIDLDADSGRYVYEVEAYKDGYEYELVLDAKTGKGIHLFKELDDWYEGGAALNQAVISIEKAKDIALAKVAGAHIEKIELDEDNGKLIYEVELKKEKLEYDLEIDGLTGKIISFKIDD